MKRTFTIWGRIVIIFLGSILGATVSAAQTHHTLSGKIMDAAEGGILPGAVIRLFNDHVTWTLADTKGRFTMDLPEGTIRLEISYIGYQTQVSEFLLDRDKDTLFFLVPQSYYLQGVTVFAETPAIRLRKAEMSVERIDVSVIERVPTLFGEVDLLKVVQLLPGVQAASEGSSGFHVRGGSPDQNMILFDNTALYNVSHMLGFFFHIQFRCGRKYDSIQGRHPGPLRRTSFLVAECYATGRIGEIFGRWRSWPYFQ